MKPNKSTQEENQQNPSASSLKNYKILCTTNFLNEAKKLAKKYPKIKSDFLGLKDELKKDPITGNDFMGDDVYKVRMKITGKNSGESGGARVIIQVKIIDKVVYVLSVYDKSYLENIIDKKLQSLKEIAKSLKKPKP